MVQVPALPSKNIVTCHRVHDSPFGPSRGCCRLVKVTSAAGRPSGAVVMPVTSTSESREDSNPIWNCGAPGVLPGLSVARYMA